MPADLLTFLASEPFQPFRIHTLSGGAFDIHDRQQVGVSPGRRLFIAVLSDGRFEVLTPELIARCEAITEASAPLPVVAPPVPASTTLLSNGRVAFTPFKDRGRRLIHVSVTTDDGAPLFSTAGTRWDLSGLETFENGRTLYLHHADDPSLARRIIIWPPATATFESFAEAIPASQLQEQLRELDTSARAEPKDPEGPPKSYFSSIKPPPGYEPPMPPTTGREDGPAPDDPDRFTFVAEPYEAGPNQWANCPTLLDTFTRTVMLDLGGTNWDAVASKEHDIWTLELRYYPEGNRTLTMVIDPKAALVHFGGPALPLHIAERHLKNFALHESWEALLHVLSTDLKPDEPHFRFDIPGGAALELWPGAGTIPPPFLTARLLDPGGRAILDMRGSPWGVSLEPLTSEPTITLSLIHTEEKSRYEFRPLLTIDPASRRVTCDNIPGSTTLAALGPAIRACRTPSWMLEELQELLTRGRDIPLP